MLWWVAMAMLLVIPAIISSDYSWEGYDWEGSFTIGTEEVAPAAVDGGENKPEAEGALGGDGPVGGQASAEATRVKPGASGERDARQGGARGRTERFTFWRDAAHAEGGSRRMFGGTRVDSTAEQSRAVALIDHRGFVHCSGAALTPEWILTASHCLTPSVTSLRTAGDSMTRVALLYVYKHPQYRVSQRSVAGGLEVTSLVHDVGLAQAERALTLATLPALGDTLADMERLDLRLLIGSSLTVYGFGRVESSEKGGELFSIRTHLVHCGNPAWAPCVCGAGERGVCAGDSGGPVLYNNTQVAVTSLGPMSCSGMETSMSVFTALRPYVPLIRATVPPPPAPEQSPFRTLPAPAGTPAPAGAPAGAPSPTSAPFPTGTPTPAAADEWQRVRVLISPRFARAPLTPRSSPAIAFLLAALTAIQLI